MLSYAGLGTIPQSFCWRCVSFQKGNRVFFRSKKRCVTLKHCVQLFCSLDEGSDCRSDISEGTWPHCERKVHPSLPFQYLKDSVAGEGSELLYPNLRNVLGLDASVLQRDLDAPLVPMAAAALHAPCCQPSSCAPCRPAPGSLGVSLSARGLTAEGWCLEAESWKAQIDNTRVLSERERGLKPSSVALTQSSCKPEPGISGGW